MKNKVGGWGVVIEDDKGNRVGLKGTARGEGVTNNVMELRAMIECLKYIHAHFPTEKAQVISDSEYVIKGLNERLPGWIAKGWRCSTGPLKNVDLWVELNNLKTLLPHVTYGWVRGHDGNENNELADKLATGAYKELI